MSKWAVNVKFDWFSSLLNVFGWFFTDFSLWLSIPTHLCSVWSCAELACDWIIRWLSTNVSFELFLHNIYTDYMLFAAIGRFSRTCQDKVFSFTSVYNNKRQLALFERHAKANYQMYKNSQSLICCKQISLFLDLVKRINSLYWVVPQLFNRYKFSHLLFVWC